MRSKKELMDNLNKFVLIEICSVYPNLKKFWEDVEFQKRLATVLGVKAKDLNNGPKRNKSSYLFFCQDVRPSIVAETPNIKPNEVMVSLGRLWAELNPEDKLKYDVMAEEDRKRYITLKEANKKLNKPVKISTYLQFCADERPMLKTQHPDLSTKDITAKLGSLWNEYKKVNPQYLKTKYGFEATTIAEDHRSTLTPSIPAGICSKNVRAIQDLISK